MGGDRLLKPRRPALAPAEGPKRIAEIARIDAIEADFASEPIMSPTRPAILKFESYHAALSSL
jgi:hypothetical protein